MTTTLQELRGPAQAKRSRISPAAAAIAFLLLLSLVHDCAQAFAAEPRHRPPIKAFRRTHPCPSTGKTTGKCDGFVVDHVYPRCAGGPDTPENMQWEELEQSYRKDRLEREVCALRAKLAQCKIKENHP